MQRVHGALVVRLPVHVVGAVCHGDLSHGKASAFVHLCVMQLDKLRKVCRHRHVMVHRQRLHAVVKVSELTLDLDFPRAAQIPLVVERTPAEQNCIILPQRYHRIEFCDFVCVRVRQRHRKGEQSGFVHVRFARRRDEL